MKLTLLLSITLALVACQSTPVFVKPKPNDCCQVKTEKQQVIIRVPPRYPAIAARANQSGWVQLEFDIDEKGNVINLKVKDHSPEGFNFETQAYKAVEKWKYQKNKAVKNKTVTLEFKLN